MEGCPGDPGAIRQCFQKIWGFEPYVSTFLWAIEKVSSRVYGIWDAFHVQENTGKISVGPGLVLSSIPVLVSLGTRQRCRRRSCSNKNQSTLTLIHVVVVTW